MRNVLVPALVLATAAAAATTVVASVTSVHAADARARSVTVHRGGSDKTIAFHRGRPGEVFPGRRRVSARGVSWAERKNESAVVSAYVDGHYTTDIVVTSASPVAREFALGPLGKGRHTLRLHYAGGTVAQ